MEAVIKGDVTIVYTGMNVPEEWDEDWAYYAEAEFEEQEDGSWKKIEEYDVECHI